jgi:hypothetical protein
VDSFCITERKKHEHNKPQTNQHQKIAKLVSRAPALARPDAGFEHVDLQFGTQLEPDLQSGSTARERLVLNNEPGVSSHLRG